MVAGPGDETGGDDRPQPRPEGGASNRSESEAAPWSQEVAAQPDKDAHSPPLFPLPGYELLREISRGGQAVVYEAIQRSTGRRVAVKVLHERSLAGSAERARFEREVKILAALDHPNVVAIVDRGRTPDGTIYLVMEYVAGRTLDELFAAAPAGEGRGGARSGSGHGPAGPLGDDELLRLFLKICDGVNMAH